MVETQSQSTGNERWPYWALPFRVNWIYLLISWEEHNSMWQELFNELSILVGVLSSVDKVVKDADDLSSRFNEWWSCTSLVVSELLMMAKKEDNHTEHRKKWNSLKRNGRIAGWVVLIWKSVCYLFDTAYNKPTVTFKAVYSFYSHKMYI